MSKILLLVAVLLAVLVNTATATNIRRRTGGGVGGNASRGAKKRKTEHSPRRLKEHYGIHPNGYETGKGKRKGGKGGTSKGQSKSKGTVYKMSQPKCRPVVEGAEFILEGAIVSTMANMTDDPGMIGTEFIYNGPLLEFDQNDELTELENFFMSGTCVRTQERDGDMPGAGHCSFTITLDTGATMNFAGEAFDGWDNLMAINGGSQELIGLSGTVTLIGLNDDFEDTAEDFFSVPWIYGEAVLVYSICPQGYWDQYYIDSHDALPPPSIPDPFQRQAVEATPYGGGDDDGIVGDDDAAVGDDDNGY